MTDSPPRPSPPAPGEPAPDFTLRTQGRADWTLSREIERGPVALCFFPFAFTGVCGTEMECISREMARWSAQGAQVVGVSCDSPPALKAWAEQMGFTHTLLSDLHRTVCKAYGLYWPEQNVAARGTVIVRRSQDGRPVVAWSQKREIKQAMNFDDVLAALH